MSVALTGPVFHLPFAARRLDRALVPSAADKSAF